MLWVEEGVKKENASFFLLRTKKGNFVLNRGWLFKEENLRTRSLEKCDKDL